MATDAPLPSNAELAALLRKIGGYLALHGEEGYRVLAYERAADVLQDYPASAATLALQGELRSLPGIGAAMEAKVLEYLHTGLIHLLVDLEARYPAGLLELLQLPGLGTATVRRLWETLGVCDAAGLREACLAGSVESLKGMGRRTQERILEALARGPAAGTGRHLLGAVEPTALRLLERLAGCDSVVQATCAGSLRRRCSTVKDIDLVAGSSEPPAVLRRFATTADLSRVIQVGSTKLVAETQNGISVDLRVVSPEAYGNLLQHATGSAAHNVALRRHAQHRGLKLSENGVEAVGRARSLPFAEEEGVYRHLGLDLIPPELREDQGEIEAAAEGELPRLIEPGDLRGDLHVHTSWSDGREGIREMALAARSRGLEYICITDHSRSLAMARGLDPARLEQQREEIRDCNLELTDITILAGCEVDILADGALDLPDHTLAGLDFVIASIHSAFSQPLERIMSRLRAAAENPHVDAIAHPSGRLLVSCVISSLTVGQEDAIVGYGRDDPCPGCCR
ncbi:MAG: DNA polymerase/3'-5' exonuclease PolX [Gaiellales bacterium]|nr:DNA polymerase/3'-5' exonuclease PolX [Gaiellales bacterium]